MKSVTFALGRVAAVALLQCLCLPGPLLATSSLAGETIQSLRGALPNQSFLSAGKVESINTGSGNVLLSVPLGQVFQVGPHLRYQLRATHNSDAWDHTPVTSFDIVAALPHPGSNAGVGWEVHFGKLFQPHPPAGMGLFGRQTWPNRQFPGLDFGKRWLYVSPDGAAPLPLRSARPRQLPTPAAASPAYRSATRRTAATCGCARPMRTRC